MLSYIHSYHAGNHADILKHFILTYVLSYMNKKDKPYTFFDTHAGSGLYDLSSQDSLKTQEAQNGILKLLQYKQELQKFSSFNNYLDLVLPFLKQNFYPGSPLIEFQLLREQDSLIVSELHPQAFKDLKENLKKNNFVYNNTIPQIHNRNGFEMLKALTPPKTKRGVVLIDPSYETLQDFEQVIETVNQVNKKWTNGIIMIWYPLLKTKETYITGMKNSIINNARKINSNVEIADLQLCINTPDSYTPMELKEYRQLENKVSRLYGSGMLVINSVWNMEENCKDALAFIQQKLHA